jgi:hypothetical protein
MAPALVPDTLWEMFEPLLPLPKPKPQGGRPRMPDRLCLKGAPHPRYGLIPLRI